MKDEKDKYDQLKREKHQLESALAQSRLEALALESFASQITITASQITKI